MKYYFILFNNLKYLSPKSIHYGQQLFTWFMYSELINAVDIHKIHTFNQINLKVSYVKFTLLINSFVYTNECTYVCITILLHK